MDACNYTEINFDYPSECITICDDCCEYPTEVSDCDETELSIEEVNKNREIIKIIDILGRHVDKHNNNKIIFYLFDNGTIEKKYVIE